MGSMAGAAPPLRAVTGCSSCVIPSSADHASAYRGARLRDPVSAPISGVRVKGQSRDSDPGLRPRTPTLYSDPLLRPFTLTLYSDPNNGPVARLRLTPSMRLPSYQIAALVAGTGLPHTSLMAQADPTNWRAVAAKIVAQIAPKPGERVLLVGVPGGAGPRVRLLPGAVRPAGATDRGRGGGRRA